MIPSYPAAVGFIYPLSGLMVIFPLALANHDVEFTSLLPIRKGDIVKAKTIYIVFLEIVTILISIPGVLIRNFAIMPSFIAELEATGDTGDLSYYNTTQPSLITYASVLIAFGVFNLILIPQYYKNPYKKIIGPQLISLFVALLIMGLGTGAQLLLINLESFKLISWISLGVSIVFFVLISYLTERRGERAILKIDL